jgi:hypothetical protein
VERQKLMAKGVWTGTLKDEHDLSTLSVKAGTKIMLMGTADEVAVAPAVAVTFMEDMTAEEKAEKGAIIPAGLVNLREYSLYPLYPKQVPIFCNTFFLTFNRKYLLHERHRRVLPPHGRHARGPGRAAARHGQRRRGHAVHH